MPRRRKKNRTPPARGAVKTIEGPFNPVLGVRPKQRRPKVLPAAEAPPPQQPQEIPDETEIFLRAMTDVKPLVRGKGIVTSQPDPHLRPPHTARDDELEVMAHLSDLISGAAQLDITFSDEYIEGCVPGFSRKLMQRLKRGEFPVQDYIDLHGLTKQEAEAQQRGFLIRSQQLGLRCVLVVHGRGLNSENNIPVLKERLPVWLNRGSIKRIVLAFSTARPYDGGTGAIYILLRKWRSGR